jgi:hypothetical protein
MTLRHVRTSLARFNVASKEADKAFHELMGALRAVIAVAREKDAKQPRAKRVQRDTLQLPIRRVPEVARRSYTH